jgi:hypothetical protein
MTPDVNSPEAKDLTKWNPKFSDFRRIDTIDSMLLRIPSFQERWGIGSTSLVGK